MELQLEKTTTQRFTPALAAAYDIATPGVRHASFELFFSPRATARPLPEALLGRPLGERGMGCVCPTCTYALRWFQGTATPEGLAAALVLGQYAVYRASWDYERWLDRFSNSNVYRLASTGVVASVDFTHEVWGGLGVTADELDKTGTPELAPDSDNWEAVRIEVDRPGRVDVAALELRSPNPALRELAIPELQILGGKVSIKPFGSLLDYLPEADKESRPRRRRQPT